MGGMEQTGPRNRRGRGNRSRRRERSPNRPGDRYGRASWLRGVYRIVRRSLRECSPRGPHAGGMAVPGPRGLASRAGRRLGVPASLAQAVGDGVQADVVAFTAEGDTTLKVFGEVLEHG